MSTRTGSDNRIPSVKAACSTGKTMLSPPTSARREKGRSLSDGNKMVSGDQKMISKKTSTPRVPGANSKSWINGSSPTSPRKKTSTPRRTSGTGGKGVLSREKMSNGLNDQKISINVSEDVDSDIEEARDDVFSPIGEKPLISILKVPGRARSKSLPPNMILQQLSDGMSALGPNSKLAGLLKRESSDEGSIENLGPPPGYMFNPRRVSFSLPQNSDDSGSGSSTPSYHLLPPLRGDRLSPSIINAEQGNSRKGSPYPFDHSSSESLDSDHRSPINSRPASAPKEIDIQRGPLPTGSSIFQMAMAEVSDSSDKNSESSDSESNNAERSRSKATKCNRTNKQGSRTNYLTPGFGVSYSSSPRRLSNSGASPRRISVSPRRGTPSSGVSPRKPSKSESTDSRRT